MKKALDFWMLTLLTLVLTACAGNGTPNPQNSIVGKLDIGSYPDGWSNYRLSPLDQAFTNLAVNEPSLGASVLLVTSDGEILASSELELDGRFGFSSRFSEAAVLVLASQDDSGQFICRSTLEYHDYDENGVVTAVTPAILFVGLLSKPTIDLGTFSFTGDTANPAANANIKPDIVLSVDEAPEFTTGNYLDCENRNVTRPHIRGSFSWKLPARLADQTILNRAIVIAAEFDETDSTLAPLAFAPVDEMGFFDLELSKASETTLELVLFLADQAFLEAKLSAQLHIPLVNLNYLQGLEHIFLDNEDVDFGEITLAMAYLSGQVSDAERQPINQAYIFAISNQGKLSLASETVSDETGFYELLIPVDETSYLVAGQASINNQSFVGTVSQNYHVNEVAELQENLTLLKLPR